MYITELDEYQGLTADMVREWLQAQAPRVKLEDGLWVWNPDATSLDLRGPCLGDDIQTWSLTTSLLVIHAIENKRPQQLLREINPRMRGPGYPSDAAARAHGDGGWWVFQHQAGADDPRSVTIPGELHIAQMCLSPASNDVRFYWERGLMGEPCDEACLWWPCDANGNKTRWPTDAEGNLL